MMTASTMPVIDSQLLDWNAVDKQLTAEASTLGLGLGPQRIAVRSARTGEILCYERSFTGTDREGETTHWKYRPMNFHGRHTMTRAAAAEYPVLVIFND